MAFRQYMIGDIPPILETFRCLLLIFPAIRAT
jgi:hypothetical protein